MSDGKAILSGGFSSQEDAQKNITNLIFMTLRGKAGERRHQEAVVEEQKGF